MAQVLLSSSSEDEEDGHLLVDWKSSSAGLADAHKNRSHKPTGPPNVVCIDSDSEGSPAALVDTAPSPAKVDGSGYSTENVNKKRKSQDKEAEEMRKAEERALRKQDKEEKKRQLQEEKRQRKEAEKLHRAQAREKAQQAKKLDHEREKWEKGKFALQNTIAIVDCKVVEDGLVGGQLLNRFASKEFKYSLCSNPIPHSILWKMKMPSENSDEASQSPECELQLGEVDIPYLLLVFQAEEFASLVSRGSLHAHVQQTQMQYPGFTVCYLVNKLNWYLQRKDQEQYKRGESGWVRPNVDRALAELLTDYAGVHSRLCVDEAEVADHVVALTRSLAECSFRQKLTPLSVSKNGDHIVSHDPNKEIIKKNIWLKTLVAIPKVSGAAAVAISLKYPTFRSLLNAYLDPSMTVHEKELILQDVQKEVGGSRRRVGPACSRRIYRILMAQNGDLKTEDVEVGADQFDIKSWRSFSSCKDVPHRRKHRELLQG